MRKPMSKATQTERDVNPNKSLRYVWFTEKGATVPAKVIRWQPNAITITRIQLTDGSFRTDIPFEPITRTGMETYAYGNTPLPDGDIVEAAITEKLDK